MDFSHKPSQIQQFSTHFLYVMAKTFIEAPNFVELIKVQII